MISYKMFESFKLKNKQMLLLLSLPVAGVCVYKYMESRWNGATKLVEEETDSEKIVSICVQVSSHVARLLRQLHKQKLGALQMNTKTDITLSKRSDGQPGFRNCKIEGTRANCELAKGMLLKMVKEHSVVEKKMILVKKEACGYITGIEGHILDFLCGSTDAVIDIRSPVRVEDGYPCVVIIRGTKRQVEAAKYMVLQVLIRVKRRLGYSLRFEDEEMADDPLIDVNEGIEGFGSVSAFVDFKHVYIQKTGGSKARAELEMIMGRHYSYTRTADLSLDRIKIGCIVAAQIGCSKLWSRCRVAEIIKNDEDPKKSLLSLICMDSGEVDFRCLFEVKKLLPYYYTLPPLAAHCVLKNPKNCDWPPVSFETFDELVPVGQDYEITVNIVGKETNIFGHAIPVIQIIDHQSPDMTNIAEAFEKIVYE